MEKKTRFPSPTLKAFVPRNAGKMIGAKRALKEKHVWTIRSWLGSEQRIRDKALFDLALDSKLRDVATRYDKLKSTFLEAVQLLSAIIGINLRHALVGQRKSICFRSRLWKGAPLFRDVGLFG
ncbi:hypothetical protein [Acetobacter fabarum]|uniref:hypothetical protein n=1 Tax=Acetobacter fabarum TaxID=483199 RepID=UPI001FCFFE5A|nr:hypothetical protein [Acetobacter fabarum]